MTEPIKAWEDCPVCGGAGNHDGGEMKPTEAVENNIGFVNALFGNSKPDTAKEAIERWDSGGNLWTVEMGGMGPGYEQAIQIAVIEVCRLLVDKPLPATDEELNKQYDDAIHAVCQEFELGLSGAQAQVIKSLAYHYIRDGWKKTVDGFEKDRHIQCSNHWPGKRKEKAQ